MSTQPLTTDELDRASCSTPGCDHAAHAEPMFLHARCHPKNGMRVSYAAGVLEIRCRTCKELVTRIAVARPAESSLPEVHGGQPCDHAWAQDLVRVMLTNSNSPGLLNLCRCYQALLEQQGVTKP